MDKVSLALTSLLTIALVVMIAPSIFAMNRGKVLRNIALWLAIFLGLALVYQNFGPGHGNLIKAPIVATPEDSRAAPQDTSAAPAPDAQDEPPSDSQGNADQNYAPPGE